MTESFSNIEDEAFPSFLSTSVGSSRATLGNVTLASTLGLPVAASTVAKIRAGSDNRVNAVQASYLEDGRFSLADSQSNNKEQGNLPSASKMSCEDAADDFIAAHRFSDMLVKVNLDQTEPRTRASSLGPNTQTGPLPGRHSEHGDDLSTGRLAFTNLVNMDFMDLKVRFPPGTVDDQTLASDGADSDRFSGSVASFLANEKLMSVDSMNSDVTDDDVDVNDLQDEELDLYLNQLVGPAMQRGRVEGQEIPVAAVECTRFHKFQPPLARLGLVGYDSGSVGPGWLRLWLGGAWLATTLARGEGLVGYDSGSPGPGWLRLWLAGAWLATTLARRGLVGYDSGSPGAWLATTLARGEGLVGYDSGSGRAWLATTLARRGLVGYDSGSPGPGWLRLWLGGGLVGYDSGSAGPGWLRLWLGGRAWLATTLARRGPGWLRLWLGGRAWLATTLARGEGLVGYDSGSAGPGWLRLWLGGGLMPDVRLAATGMDSCPGSDEEDTEDELETARRHTSTRHRLLLSSTSRQLVGESNRPSFRPGLEGGSSDEDSGRNPSLTGLEHRYSAEGQVINTEEEATGAVGVRREGTVECPLYPSPPPPPRPRLPTMFCGAWDPGGSVPGENTQDPRSLLGLSRGSLMGDRVGPVGTGETNSGPQRTSPVNWSMTLDRQEALDAMDSTESGLAEQGPDVLDSIYLRTGAGHWRPQDMTSHLQTTQNSFHLSQVLLSHSDDEEEEEEEEEGRGRPAALGPRGGPCGDSSAPPGPPGLSDTSRGEKDLLSTSLEAKYLSQSFHPEEDSHSDSDWNHCPDNLDFQPASPSVVYQNEEGKWVTDLAYYSSFEKEVDGKQLPESADQFQAEDFVPGSNAIEKIIEDQKVFEKENRFMQEEVMTSDSTSPGLLSDTSWRLPASSHILMRASQVSQDLDRGNQSYLRLSLGTFFQQRSEALGCLGDDREDDTVKRPSFGYVITSPEKREPFPLIQPSDFLSQDSSVRSDTDHDRTMNTEDLDKTVEAAPDRVSPTGDEEPEPCESVSPLPEALLSPSQTLPSVSPLPEALLSPSQTLPSASPLPEALLSPSQTLPSASPLPEALLSPSQTLPSASPGSLDPSPSSGTDQSNLVLSISTIASAIADASISSEPSQLAAMIMELSKRSRIQRQRQKGLPRPAPASVLEEQTPSPNRVELDQPSPNRVQLDQRGDLLEALQRSQCAGDLLEALQRSQCAGDLLEALQRSQCAGDLLEALQRSQCAGDLLEALQRSQCAGDLLEALQRSQCAGDLLEALQRSQCAGDLLEALQRSQCAGDLLEALQRSQCAGDLLEALQRSQCAGDLLEALQRSQCAGDLLEALQRSQCAGDLLEALQRSQCAGDLLEALQRSQCAGDLLEALQRSQCAGDLLEALQRSQCAGDLLEALQRSQCAGDLSAFDIEKYLKQTEEVSTSSDSDQSGTSHSLNSSHRKSQAASLVVTVENESSGYQHQATEYQAIAKGDISSSSGVEAKAGLTQGYPAATTRPVSAGLHPGSDQSGPGPANKTDVRRSSIPRPRFSSIPTASGNPGRRSVGSGQFSSTTSTAKPAADRKSAGNNNSEPQPAGVLSRSSTESGGAELGVVRPTPNNTPAQKIEDRSAAPAPGPKTSPGLRKGQSGPLSLRDITSPSQRARRTTVKTGSSTAQQEKPGGLEESGGEAPLGAATRHVGFTSSCHSPQPAAAHRVDGASPGTPLHHAGGPEQSQCTFRPSTSPLTHSSPSQTSFPNQEGPVCPPSSSVGDRRPPSDLSPPQSQSEWSCSSPSLSRLTYISLNDGTALDSTGIPTPDRHKSNGTMSLSTTIIRASPTPAVEGADTQNPSGQDLPPNRSTDVLCPPRQSKSPESPRRSNGPRSGSVDLRSGSGLGCTRSQSECNYHCGNNRDYNQQKRHSEPNSHHLAKVDSGYSSNLNIQQPSGMGARGTSSGPGSQPRGVRSILGPGRASACLPPRTCATCPSPASSPRAPWWTCIQGPSLLTGRSLFSSQLAQQNLGSDGALHPGLSLPAPYHHMAAAGNGLYGHALSSRLGPNVDPSVRHLHSSGGLGVSGPGGPGGPGGLYHCSNPHLKPLDPGLMEENPYSQRCVASWSNGSLPELAAQVVIPEELRFPHACCVGISSQTSLGIFNPSERWQQVSITVTSLAIDGEKFDSFPYQWLIVKNKTIIGPKSTEEQKVLFIPPQAGVYQAVLSVSSWPASAEAQAASRAEVFAKRVVLVAMAENPALEVDVGKCGGLDFGDLAGGCAKALPLKLLNRTHATVPVRLVISANATAWRCFTFSKSPVAMTAEGLLQAGTLTSLAAPSVMNHVMHASYGENPESFMVWVHFHAPQKYQSCSGALGPADEYSARVDIEVDCPGPSHVIRSVPLRARSGTARVHAPKDLQQTVNLSAAIGQSSEQTLPLKNAGNIDVQLKLKNSGGDDCFSVSPEELCLRAGEEQGIVVSFTSQGGRKDRESVLTILVLPSGPQYEVVLKGQVVPEERGNPAAVPGPASALGLLPPSEVPPILSNKQLVAWGGVTLGRAVQQKLVLRNNSPNTTHHLRLLIRGQDHSCFQLQSSFGQEERLTRHRELSIRPREDVVVHLLFAPTRVACALSKLEIKQSGVRPSQPGIKFTIPLSGYGGTSNIVLEDHRKRSDGYVAMLMGVAAGHVSKLCVCVRNTGSRAAFIKAVSYSDLHTRSVMDSSGISLSPSQFVLKERTQEVITVLMKVTQREQTRCLSANAVLATVCLFCGDEVSRQQFRRLLLSNPEAGRKILSQNSLLKGLNFNERFLGEEQVLEAYDLPQSPNQAQLFYGNLSKVVLSVLGSTETLDSGRSGLHVQPSLAVTRRGSEADSGFGNSDRHISNVSLDVLPVKGPQGPALPRTEASRTGTDPGDHRDSWSLQPGQLVLTSPTIDGPSNTRHVLIQNHSASREMSFELSWPAHCLTVTPQHGVMEPQSHLQILISPNPSLATRTSMFPWSGQIYVQCDNQQKFIKIQIRQDLALDVSTAPSDQSLAPLPPQTASPMPTTMLPPSNQSLAPLPPQTASPMPTTMLPPADQPPQTQTAPATVEISNRTIVFPATPSGDASESSVEVENRGQQVRWYLSSFAPPYVKGVDSSGDVYRATYTAFRCPRVSGILGANDKMQVPITFLPRDRGDYAQFWDLECHPVAEPQHKTRIRFQLCGTGVKVGPAAAPQEADCSLVKTEAFKTRRRPDPVADGGMTGQEEPLCRGVYAPRTTTHSPPTRVGETSTLKVNMRNNSLETHGLMFLTPKEPFHIKHSRYSLRSQRYIHLPVQFKPVVTGNHSSQLLVQTDTSGNIAIQLTGEALA
ncbi:LOW QUALITY PROTEIN: centrosomal protein of 192 kDa [Salmo salar]|uniref:LOW QUALITY PROTEIN: centrosomal protein of 192 kDa n=1 Tax=Salmo salar TaxID=8030 RepID=A0ABM3EEN1_SALSA|nr:LOW QUALITY PROTEIN: centrosomal protein of 192 kDa [Salmo salar]